MNRTLKINALALAAATALSAAAAADKPAAPKEPLAVRADNLTVTPSTGPVTYVTVRNLRDDIYKGMLTVKFPDGWKVTPARHDVVLGPRETKRFPFAIEKGIDAAANCYPYQITVAGAGAKVVREQNVICAGAPYYKPAIDGDLAEWKDSIPVAFTTAGKRTVVRTYWNRRNFCLAVEVEEDKLIPCSAAGGAGEKPFDAVQFALAPRDAKTGTSPEAKAARHEFLAAGDKCFRLIAPPTKLSRTSERVDLARLAVEKARVAVRREKNITRYEISVPFGAMPGLRPTTGREFCFSLLVHDPDGTGVRDLGRAASPLPARRNPLAWCSWRGVKWGPQRPLDGKIEWGFCSSIH